MFKLPKINISKEMRNLLTILLFAIVLLEVVWAWNYFAKPTTSTPAVVAAPEATLSLSPAEGTFTVGENFEVQVTLVAEDATATDGVDVTLSFDPTKLEVLDVSSTDFYPQRLLNTVDNETGTVRLGVANTPDRDGIKGGGIVATITFTALQSGETEISFGDSSIASGGLNILSQTTGGSYLIE